MKIWKPKPAPAEMTDFQLEQEIVHLDRIASDNGSSQSGVDYREQLQLELSKRKMQDIQRKQFMEQLPKLPLAEAIALRDSGKLERNSFELAMLCIHIAKKGGTK